MIGFSDDDFTVIKSATGSYNGQHFTVSPLLIRTYQESKKLYKIWQLSGYR